jgi:hypothetical protein
MRREVCRVENDEVEGRWFAEWFLPKVGERIWRNRVLRSGEVVNGMRDVGLELKEQSSGPQYFQKARQKLPCKQEVGCGW